MPRRPKSKQRSGCPVSRSLEILGYCWSLLVIRDLMIRGAKNFKDFQGVGRKNREQHSCRTVYEAAECGTSFPPKPAQSDGRRIDYRLTQKGIDLAPVLLELLLWGGQHEEDSMPPAMIEKMKQPSRSHCRRSSTALARARSHPTASEDRRVVSAVKQLVRPHHNF